MRGGEGEGYWRSECKQRTPGGGDNGVRVIERVEVGMRVKVKESFFQTTNTYIHTLSSS